MYLCDDNGHGEIVHEDRRCPACARINDIENDCRALEKDIESANERISELEAELAATKGNDEATNA